MTSMLKPVAKEAKKSVEIGVRVTAQTLFLEMCLLHAPFLQSIDYEVVR